MPPCARQPTTSYCPPTSAPGCSLGSKSNGVRHFGQKPLVRPGEPSRARPTGAAAHRAEPLVLGDDRRVHQRLTRVEDGHRRRPASARRRAATSASSRASRRVGRLPPVVRAEPSGTRPRRLVHRADRVRSGRRVGGATPGRRRAARRSRAGCRRHAADVAVAVDDGAGAAGLRAAHQLGSSSVARPAASIIALTAAM